MNQKDYYKCLECNKSISSYPRWYCYQCKKYLCKNCKNLYIKKDHFYLLETDPIICDPIVKCIECQIVLLSSDLKWFCDECMGYICQLCYMSQRR